MRSWEKGLTTEGLRIGNKVFTTKDWYIALWKVRGEIPPTTPPNQLFSDPKTAWNDHANSQEASFWPSPRSERCREEGRWRCGTNSASPLAALLQVRVAQGLVFSRGRETLKKC